jgi:riboflavin synthase
MFTGIVETMGTLVSRTDMGGDARLVIETGTLSLAECRTGDSISVSGACLTMLEPLDNSFAADVSLETLGLTTLGGLAEGGKVNLELAMGVHDRMGGHLVTGHVDGLGRLVSRHEDGRAERFEFEVPKSLAKYVARKGSVCIDGVSLTVNDVDGLRFGVCLIPHTTLITTLGNLQPGDQVNIEVDLIARYLERLMSPEFAEND